MFCANKAKNGARECKKVSINRVEGKKTEQHKFDKLVCKQPAKRRSNREGFYLLIKFYLPLSFLLGHFQIKLFIKRIRFEMMTSSKQRNIKQIFISALKSEMHAKCVSSDFRLKAVERVENEN